MIKTVTMRDKRQYTRYLFLRSARWFTAKFTIGYQEGNRIHKYEVNDNLLRF
jgi:hypothetical protein